MGLLQSRIIPFVPWFSLLLLIKNRVEGVDEKSLGLRLSSEWNNCSFGTVDVDTITKKVAEYNKALTGPRT